MRGYRPSRGPITRAIHTTADYPTFPGSTTAHNPTPPHPHTQLPNATNNTTQQPTHVHTTTTTNRVCILGRLPRLPSHLRLGQEAFSQVHTLEGPPRNFRVSFTGHVSGTNRYPRRNEKKAAWSCEKNENWKDGAQNPKPVYCRALGREVRCLSKLMKQKPKQKWSEI